MKKFFIKLVSITLAIIIGFNIIFNKSKAYIAINFRRHVWWYSGAYSEKEVKDLGIFNKNHPENSLFIKELKKKDGKPLVSHNFHNLL